MSKRAVFTCILTVALAQTGYADANATTDAITFRFVTPPGQVIKQSVVSKSVGSTRLSPPLPEMKFSTICSQEIISECKQVYPDGSAVIEMTTGNMAMKMTSGPKTFEFDSKTYDPAKATDPIAQTLGRLFTAVNGTKMTLTFGPDGKPTKVTGLREAFIKAIKPIMDETIQKKGMEPIAQMIEQMSGMFDDTTMTRQMQSYYRMLPDKKGPVRIGDKWAHEWHMDLPMFGAGCTAKGEYELAGIEPFRGRSCARIHLKESFQMGTNTGQAKGPRTKPAGPLGALFDQMDFKLTTSGGEGTAYWDYQKGVLVQLRQTQRMTIEATIKGHPPTTAPAATPHSINMVQQFQTSVQLDLLD